MPKAKRKLKNLHVEFISLVDAGANRREIVWKRDNPLPHRKERIRMDFKIRKIDEEKRLVYGIVYAPDEVDTHGDTMETAEIEKAAHAFLAAGKTNRVDKQHDGTPDRGFIVESYLISKNDARFPEDPAGAWAVVIKVTDDETWEEVKKGDIGGISLEGVCEVEELEKAETSFMKAFFKQFGDFMQGTISKQEAGGRRQKAEGSEQFFGTFDQALKAIQEDPELVTVKKDFNMELSGRKLWVAIHALDAANQSVLFNDFITDKKGALRVNAEQFLTHLESIEVQKQQSEEEDDMSEEAKKQAAEEAKKAAEEKSKSAGTGEGQEGAEQPVNEEYEKKVKALEEKIERLEKAAGVEQGTEGREETKTSKSKGLPIIS